MTDHLVLIRTFQDLFEADDAQAELYAAGIYSLLLAEEPESVEAADHSLVGLAVHRRDADIADAVLCQVPGPHP